MDLIYQVSGMIGMVISTFLPGTGITISYMVNYWYQGTWYPVLNTPGTNRSACKAVVATGTWYQVPGNLYRSFFPVAWCSQVPTGGERTSST